MESEWRYHLPTITKLVPLSNDRTILQSTVAVIAVRTHDGLISEFPCKSWPNCLEVVDKDTILLGSHSGKAKIYYLNCDNVALEELYNSHTPIIHANNYCKDLALLPNQRFMMASPHEFVIGSYCLEKPAVRVEDIVKHGFDFVAAMKVR